jgi:hypothetical protein
MSKLKLTKDQMAWVKTYWVALEHAEAKFYAEVKRIEEAMQKQTGIEDIEFFACDGEYVGIGNDSRTMDLIHMR